MQEQHTHSAKVLAINVHQQPVSGFILQEGGQSSPVKQKKCCSPQSSTLFGVLCWQQKVISPYFASVCSNF
jgi:hypothetical protein